MKFGSTFLAAVAAQSAAAAAVNSNAAFSNEQIVDLLLANPHLQTPNSYRALQVRTKDVLEKRQAPGAAPAKAGGMFGKMGAAPTANAPKSLVEAVQDEASKVGWGNPDVKRRKIRYGPYRIPPISEKNFESEFLHVQGMSNALNIGIKKPCDKACTILALQADLEYADGKPATNADGAWFHHNVLLNTGPKVVDGNCGAAKIDNMMMIGNERSVNGYALPNATIKSGYKLNPEDTFVLQAELMNLLDKEQWVWMTIAYEILDGHPADYKDGRMLWMSIGPMRMSCPGSNIKNPWTTTNLTMGQQPKSEVFSEHSFPWKAPRDGWILATGGHMHDGGETLEIFQNDKVICTSRPTYTKGAGHGHSMAGKKARRQIAGGKESNNEIAHIDKQPGCNFPTGNPLKKGDTMYLSANYNFKRYPGMKNTKGELDEVMGIVGSIVAF